MMRYFAALLFVQLKSALRSAAFYVSTAFFLAVMLLLAAVLPENNGVNLQVGVTASGDIASTAANALLENAGFTVTRYTDDDALRRDVLAGVLHCGYRLDDQMEPPVTVYLTDASYMRPLTDEIVLAAYMDARAPGMAKAFLEDNGIDGSNTALIYERLRISEPPLSIELHTRGEGASIEALTDSGVQPLLYAVLITVFFGVTVLSALLEAEGRAAAYRQLAVFSGHRAVTAFAPALAGALVNLAVLLAADGLMHALFLEDGAYSEGARVLAFCALSVLMAVISPLMSRLRRWTGIVVALLPPFLFIGIICSGAIVDPVLLPAGMGALRFLSPAWYFLRLMAIQ